jgi:hypothetical protein
LIYNDREFLEKLKSLERKEKEIQELRKSTKADPVFEENIDEIFRFGTDNIVNLLNKIKFTLTRLKPDELDVAKYFEVMNNRGKQLEKHEILKSYFLADTSNNDRWNEKEKSAYAVIWDYCSRIETFFEDFIVTYERSEKDKDKKIVEVRKQIMGMFDGNKNFAGLLKQNSNENDKNLFGRESIEKLLKEEPKSDSSREGVDTHQTPLKFSYFLLHVLDIWLHRKKCDKEVLYNDAKLLEQFIEYLDVKNISIKDKKAFIHFLFKCRILYDYYIFYRDDKKEPVLRRIVFKDEKWIKEQNVDLELLNIQLLFNLSADFHTQDWIAPVLSFLLEKSNANETIFDHYDTLKEFLEKLDDALAAERLGDRDLKKVYRQAIQKASLNDKANELDVEKVKEKVNRGVSTEHYWFYRLDYKLWKAYKDGNPWEDVDLGNMSAEEGMIEKFYLKTLNSVEHIYPQTPTDECEENWQEMECLDNFGNLALISKHMNSKLSNQCFEKKRADVKTQIEKGTVESLKLLLVFAKYDKWTVVSCGEHQTEMLSLLQKPHHAAEA